LNRIGAVRFSSALKRTVMAAIAAAVAFVATPSFAEDQPLPKDTIFARKVAMGEIDMNMDEIETMLAPDITNGTLASDAAWASISSASRRKIPATPVGEIPNGLA